MIDISILDEPLLEFGHRQLVVDPHDGLSLFGPFDRHISSRPGNLSYGVIGTETGVGDFHRFAHAIETPHIPDREFFDVDLWPPWPGFEAAFNCSWSAEPAFVGLVDGEPLLHASRLGEPHDRAYAVVEHYLQHLSVATLRDERPRVMFCVVPEEVFRNCRPLSRVSVPRQTRGALSKEGRQLVFAGQRDLLDTGITERFSYSVDFRRQLKARSFSAGIPLQLVRETTLRLADRNVNPNERTLTPVADRAWNLATTAYYKAGGKPWRLAAARPGVCYIGLAFRLVPNPSTSNTAACAAQMFLESGDGIVFKGETGPWYSEKADDFHLSEPAAFQLLTGVLKTYEALGGQPLTEVFLHSRSDINSAEFAGYRRAVPESIKLVGIRVRSERSDGIKLFRHGTRPVMRGTLWRLSNRAALLWASGFVARQRDYVGGEVPVPIRIDIQHGEADVLHVAQDILALTKLNFNACRIGESQPVTVGFSSAVGEILVGNAVDDPPPQFRYYI